MVQITPKGQESVNKKLQLKDVESDFLNFYSDEKNKSIVTNVSKGSSPQDLIDSGFSVIESQIKSDLLEKLKDIDPFYFEKVILILLKKMGMAILLKPRKLETGYRRNH